MRGWIRRRYLPLLAALWVALLLPSLGARYSFGWDSSQFSRAVTDFDIARHQPHPPGYPLWVLALRGLSPVVGNPNRAQVLLALLFAAAGLWFFAVLAREWLGGRSAFAAALLLAFSPLICMNAGSSQIYIVDFFVSCFSGWFAAGLLSGRLTRAAPGLAVIAVAAGFRPSGVVFLFPILAFALWTHGRRRPLDAVAALATGTVCGLAWLTPTALLSGGFGLLARLNRGQMAGSFALSSIFFGAPAAAHIQMAAAATVYLGFAVIGFAPALLASTRSTVRKPLKVAGPAWSTSAFFLLWMGPGVALVYLFHCGQPGYVLLSVPPLALLLGHLARGPLDRAAWTATGVAATLLLGWFPFERLMDPSGPSKPLSFLRATPRIVWLTESSQRELRALIDAMPGQPREKLVYCLLRRSEAPNFRTVTYDFADVAWVDSAGGSLPSPPPGIRSAGWLCEAGASPGAVRAQYSAVRRTGGNQLYSFWTAAVKPDHVSR
jgi:hypothetical protein